MQSQQSHHHEERLRHANNLLSERLKRAEELGGLRARLEAAEARIAELEMRLQEATQRQLAA